MTLPSFLGLGALKAGTSTVHAMLQRHPGVALPLHQKELMFFDRHWDRGPAWYEAQFAHAAGRPAGEISPSYLFEPAVPARVAQVVPAARLFAVLREPVARLESQYRFFAKEQGYRGAPRDFLRDHPNAFARGLYGAQLARWADHFPADQLLVLLSDDLAGDTAAALRPLLRHLRVDDAIALGEGTERFNEAATPRSQALWTAGRRVARWLYDHDLAWVVDAARRAGLRERLLHRRAPDVPPFDDALKAELRARYADDVAATAARLGDPRITAWAR
jgi:hypothetical protein